MQKRALFYIFTVVNSSEMKHSKYSEQYFNKKKKEKQLIYKTHLNPVKGRALLIEIHFDALYLGSAFGRKTICIVHAIKRTNAKKVHERNHI